MSNGPDYDPHGVRYGQLLDHDQRPNNPIMSAQPNVIPTMIIKQPTPANRQPNLVTLLLIVALVVLMIVALIEGTFYLMIMNRQL